MKKKLLGKKKFTVSNHKYFTNISFDRNPVHHSLLNSKLSSKKIVVHGTNILISAIDFWFKEGKKRPETIQCSFIKPIKIYDEADFFYFKIDKYKYSIEIIIKNIVHTKIIFDFNISHIDKNNKFSSSNSSLIKKTKLPLNLAPKSFINKKFKIKLDKKLNYKKFHFTKTKFGKDLYSSLLAISFFIGMVCPGKNAIFASIKFKFNKIINKNNYIYFCVKKFDSRINIFEIITKGFIHSEIKAFYRPSYQKEE